MTDHGIRWSILLSLVITIGACGGGGDTQGAGSGSPAGTQASPGVGTPGGTGAGAGGQVVLDTGEASVTAGDYSEEMTLQEQGYVFSNGSFTGAWSKLGSGGFLNVTSAEGTGTFPTSATTTLGVRLSPGAVSETIRINSSDGSCMVTIDRAGPDGVEGSFECSAEGVSGTFSAG